jgi:hypothetical protein
MRWRRVTVMVDNKSDLSTGKAFSATFEPEQSIPASPSSGRTSLTSFQGATTWCKCARRLRASMSAQGIDDDQRFLSKVEGSSRRNGTTKHHKATHTPPPILLPSPIGHDDSRLLCLARIASKVNIEDDLPTASLLVHGR